MAANPKRYDDYDPHDVPMAKHNLYSVPIPVFEYDEDALHFIRMTEEAFEAIIAIESDYRYEFIDGAVYDMTGSTMAHAIITSNIEDVMREQLGKRGPCRVYHDQYVEIPGKPSVVPDVVLTCDRGDSDKDKQFEFLRIQSPLIVVEVLSPSTQRYDRTEKFARYRRCPTLEVYILVHQEAQHVEVFRRSTDWKQEHFYAGQAVQFEQLGLELPVESIYESLF